MFSPFIYIFLFKKILYLFLAVRGLCCYEGFSLRVVSGGSSRVVVRGLLVVVVLQGTWASVGLLIVMVLQGTWASVGLLIVVVLQGTWASVAVTPRL